MAASERKSPLLTLPKELLFEGASLLPSFKDLNSLLRTSRFLHTFSCPELYRSAIAADNDLNFRDNILPWVLSEYRIASLKFLLNNGLSAHQKLGEHSEELLLWTYMRCHDHQRLLPLTRLLIERGADIEAKDRAL
jgi:hypothetical protein